MEPIVQWLEGLGLGQYGEAFVQADIDLTGIVTLAASERGLHIVSEARGISKAGAGAGLLSPNPEGSSTSTLVVRSHH